MSSLSQKKNYNAVDAMRFFCAILVVAIHTQFLSGVSFTAYFFLMAVCSVAVPFFYVCSGFFLVDKFSFSPRGKIEKGRDNLRVMLQYVKRIAITYLIWSVAYYLLNGYRTVRDGGSLGEFLSKIPKSFFLNGSEYHLWYVVCLIWAVPLLYLFLRFVGLRGVPFLMTALFLIGQFYEGYSSLNTPFHLWLRPAADAMEYGFMIFSRAIPFLCVGALLRKKEYRIGRNACLALSAVCFLFGTAETFLIYRFLNEKVNLRYNMFLLGTMFFLFAFLIRLPSGSPRMKPKAVFLRNMSSFAYFVHPFIARVYQLHFTTKTPFYFFIIAGSSLLVSAAVVAASKKLRILKYIY